MCGHQLGDFLIYFLVPSCAVELPLYPFFGHQREERLDLLDPTMAWILYAKPFSHVWSVIEEQRGFKKWWGRVLCLFTVWSVVARFWRFQWRHLSANQWKAVGWHHVLVSLWLAWNQGWGDTKIVPDTRYYMLVETRKYRVVPCRTVLVEMHHNSTAPTIFCWSISFNQSSVICVSAVEVECPSL